MRVGREEALDIFRKWLSDRALLRCNCDLYGFAAAFLVRVESVSDERIDFFSDDRTSELALPLSKDLEFGYGEPGRVSPEAVEAVSALVVFLPPPGPDRDALAFTEIVEG